MIIHKGSIRQTLEKVLGKPVEDQQWKRIIELGWVLPDELTIEGDRDIQWLASEYRKTWPAQAAKREPVRITRPHPEKERALTSYGEALSSLFAWHAHGDNEVQAFRNNVIGKDMLKVFGKSAKRLITMQTMVAWPQKAQPLRAFKDNDSFALLSLEPTQENSLGFYQKRGLKITKKELALLNAFAVEAWITRTAKNDKGKKKPPSNHDEALFLEYGVSKPNAVFRDDLERRFELVIPGGVLDKLRIISERLSKTYRWDIPSATLFVLTGSVPWISRIDASVLKLEIPGDPETEISGIARLRLTIDPTLPPEKVAAFYKKCREMILTKPFREPRSKALALAYFAGEIETINYRKQATPKLISWEEKRLRWNESYGQQFPAWKYVTGQESNFIRDYKSAKQKLLSPPVTFLNFPETRHFYDRQFDEAKED